MSRHASRLLAGVAASNAAVVGQAPAIAMAMTYLAAADSAALVMQNAAAQQQRMQVIATAALAMVIAQIVRQGASS